MYQAILFDLDDTLLRNDMTAFVQSYFGSLAPRIKPFFPQDDFIKVIYQATQSMITAPRSERTLREVFIERFEALSGLKFLDLEPIFLHYYQNEFKSVRSVSRSLPMSREILQTARRISDHLVLATIPIFPLIAIQERLSWAEIQDFSFSLVTSFEVMHCCKPNPDYFLEICEKIDCNPSRCLMIGNDHVDDLAAKATGMATFLVTDFERNAGKGAFAPDHSGSFGDLLLYLKRVEDL
jgi:FMN phosphatase YigB (HAD superfamily)